MEIWYLLITKKLLYIYWLLKSYCFEFFRDGKYTVFEPKSWWKYDIYWLLKSSCDGIHGLFSAKTFIKRWYLLGFPWYSKTWKIWFFLQCPVPSLLFCCYLLNYGTTKLEDNNWTAKWDSLTSMGFFTMPVYNVILAKADVFLLSFLEISETWSSKVNFLSKFTPSRFSVSILSITNSSRFVHIYHLYYSTNDISQHYFLKDFFNRSFLKDCFQIFK